MMAEPLAGRAQAAIDLLKAEFGEITCVLVIADITSGENAEERKVSIGYGHTNFGPLDPADVLIHAINGIYESRGDRSALVRIPIRGVG